MQVLMKRQRADGTQARKTWLAARCAAPLDWVFLCRWERAQKLGLDPPQDVKQILEGLPEGDPLHLCIWAGRV